MREEFLQCLVDNCDDSVKKKPFAKFHDTGEEFENLISKYPTNSKTKERWRSKKIIPLDKVLQELKEGLENKIDYVTDYKDSSKFSAPEKPVQPKMAYFVGVAAGDGGFNGEKVWTLVDGGKKHQLKHSKKFLESISSLIEDRFKVNTGIRKRKNRYELYVSNKWFCRFLQNYYNLPSSYKKGKLSRPEIFNNESQISAYWRGVFDADGAVAKNSNRITLSSATRSFLEQCRNDFDRWGISVHEIRQPGSYLLRLRPEAVPKFADKVGFSHPRKKKLLLEKLERGSRHYNYAGRKTKAEEYYPLAEIKGLRVLKAGEKINEFREEQNLYQEELAELLSVSKNQIWAWENNKNATPITALVQLFETEEDMYEYLSDSQNKFKYGLRGNENSDVYLPKKPSMKIDSLAERCVATAQEVRIKNRNMAVAQKFENVFDVDVKDTNKLFIDNKAVFKFFSQFYNYKPIFQSRNKERIKAINSRLSL